MTAISDMLDKHGYFHDWYLESIVIRGKVNSRIPDTLTFGLFDDARKTEVMFNVVTRLGIESGGALNIANSVAYRPERSSVSAG